MASRVDDLLAGCCDGRCVAGRWPGASPSMIWEYTITPACCILWSRVLGSLDGTSTMVRMLCAAMPMPEFLDRICAAKACGEVEAI